MTTLIIHLTDIHIERANDPILGRAKLLAAAATSDLSVKADHCHLVLSGDIAQSGRPEQYEFASGFISQVASELRARTSVEPKVFIVPGNHDCLLPADMSARLDLIDSIKTKGSTTARESQLLDAQSAFWDFVGKLNPQQQRTNAWETTLTDDAAALSYVGINSALLASGANDQGKLSVPVSALSHDRGKCLVAYVMHHPLSWMESNNSNKLLEHMRERADLMFFGHEHRDDLTRIDVLYNDATYEAYFGDVLQDRSNLLMRSGFRTIALDQEGDLIKAAAYKWSFTNYERDDARTDADWRPFKRNNGRGNVLSFTNRHLEWIDDAGAAYTHRRKENLQLADIFVWPSLRQNIRDAEQTVLIESSKCTADKLFNETPIGSVVFILGDEQSGKTTLAKQFCLLFRKLNHFPLYLSAKDSSSPIQLGSATGMERAVSKQYGEHSINEYIQLSAEKRVLIIDDFELVKGNSEAKKALFENLSNKFARIFVFVNSSPGFEISIDSMTITAAGVKTLVYDFLPLSYKVRAELIEKWLSIGQQTEVEREEIESLAIRCARVVDDTLGRNLIPSVPIFVLIILQQAEAERDLSTVIKNGSQGFLYQALITQTLQKKVPLFSVDTATTYLTMFAGKLFVGKADGLDDKALLAFHLGHSTDYDLDYKFDRVRSQFMGADIWEEKSDLIAFRYTYLYYFFVANYLCSAEAEFRYAAVDILLDTIHTERSANILLFLAHLSLDHKIIMSLMARAHSCFEGVAQYDLFASANLLNKVGSNQVRQVYIEYANARDRLEEFENSFPQDESVVDEAEKFDALKDQDLVIGINRSFKTLQVLGQVLRNHSGSLKGPVKKDIMESCVGLGLRTLGALFKTIDITAQSMIRHRLDQEFANISEYKLKSKELQAEAEEVLKGMVINIAVGTLVKISSAIGSEELGPTIEKVLMPTVTGTRSVVDLAVRLEHFAKFPAESLSEFRLRKVSANEVMPAAVIRRFICRRFYLFPDRHELKARVCDAWSISRKAFHLGVAKKQQRAIALRK
ncbi:MAG: metallophosphoesterase [Dokdonella sp.]